ncbi:MAG: dihydropteroate synthase [Candidatus Rokubacteria bacterium]|nr:dihydropteroate synthase [Candidatus Rokubacteria bacterium]
MSDALIVIGENLNATRKLKATSPRIVPLDDHRWGLGYTDLGGTKRVLDLTECYPKDPEERGRALVPYIAQAIRVRDLDYLAYAVHAQIRAGADLIDCCVDEMSPWPEERMAHMRWLITTLQSMTDVTLSVDSSDPDTIAAGLEVYDRKKSRPCINSVNLEEGRLVLLDLAREYDALLVANASGREGMPSSAQERVDNLCQVMGHMDRAGIPLKDRYLDGLVFPIGAGPDFGTHYLDAIRMLREHFGPEVHLFGGHSNVSFGMPNRKLLNDAFLILSILAGCDCIMVDPLMNPPRRYLEFKLAADALTAKDEYGLTYLAHCRASA